MVLPGGGIITDRSGIEHVKINHSDKLIEVVQRASRNMTYDEYANATGLGKDFIFSILKGEIEKVDAETLKKLSLLS